MLKLGLTQEHYSITSEIKPMALREKPAIARELIESVYFRNSSETAVHCLKRINSLISNSHQKLINYQNNHHCHVKWGAPILINRQTKESLLKESMKNNNKNLFRRSKTAVTMPISDQYDYISSSDSDNIVSRNDSDEDWNLCKERTRTRKLSKRKPALTITRTQSGSPKQKKAKLNCGNQSSMVGQSTDNLTEVPCNKTVNEINVLDQNNLESTNKINVAASSGEDPPKILNTTKGLRKSFQLQNTVTIDHSNLVHEHSPSKVVDILISTKRSLNECSDLTSQDKVKKKKISGTFEQGKSSLSSQDLFESDDEKHTADENEIFNSDEKQGDTLQIEKSDNLLAEDSEPQFILEESRSIEKNEATDSLEVTIVNDIQCPMCSQLFSIKDIEVHASDCDGLPALIPVDGDGFFDRKLRNSSRRQ